MNIRLRCRLHRRSEQLAAPFRRPTGHTARHERRGTAIRTNGRAPSRTEAVPRSGGPILALAGEAALATAGPGTRFEPGVTYSGCQVNAILEDWHRFRDWTRLRRDLCDAGYLEHEADGSRCWLGGGPTADYAYLSHFSASLKSSSVTPPASCVFRVTSTVL